MNNMVNHSLIITSDFKFEYIEKYFSRILENTNGKKKLLILFVIGRERNEKDIKTELLCKNISKVMSDSYDILKPELLFLYEATNSRSKLINSALRKIKSEIGEITNYVTIMDDLIDITKDSLKFLERGLKSDFILTRELLKCNLPAFDLEDYNENFMVGFVGPCATFLSGEQQVKYNDQMDEIGIDTWSQEWHRTNIGNYLLTKEISFRCISLTKDCINSCWIEEQDGLLDETLENYFYSKDFFVRAYANNFLGVVSTDCFVGKTKKINERTNIIDINSNSINDKINFLLKYRNNKNNKVCASYTFAPNSLNDINQFKTSFSRSAKIFDSVAVLVTKNPSDCMNSYDGVLYSQMHVSDRLYLEKCMKSNNDQKLISSLTEEWLENIVKECQLQFENYKTQNPNYKDHVDFNTNLKVDTFICENYRDCKNELIKLSKTSDCDWCFSLNHSEVIEDRITNKLIRRWVSHPNPLIFSGNISKVYHWENANIIRKDDSFLDVVETRLFRLTDEVIVSGAEDNGLHCGHSPDYGEDSCLTTGIRIRDLSLVRVQDRQFHFNKLVLQNTDRNMSLSKIGDYKNILAENVITSLFFPSNGVGLTMLTYRKDEVSSLERWLNYSYMFFDKINFVWTGEWEEQDKVWIDTDLDDLPNKDEWYSTGPSWEHAILVKLYNVDFVHKKLDKENDIGLSHCRNAGIEHLIENNDGSLRWGVFFDPDETYESYNLLFEQIKNIAELRNIHAYVFRFKNLLNTINKDKHEYSYSESIRMFYLEPNKNLLMSGLVHEGFEESLHKFRQLTGRDPKVVQTAIQLTNHGLSKSSEKMGDKLKNYATMLVNDLKDNIADTKAWMSLGLQFLNDRNNEDGLYCLQKACESNMNSYMPHKELGLQYLRLAKAYLEESNKICPREKNNWKSICYKITDFIDDQKIDLPIIDTDGYTIKTDDQLYSKFNSLKDDLETLKKDSTDG